MKDTARCTDAATLELAVSPSQQAGPGRWSRADYSSQGRRAQVQRAQRRVKATSRTPEQRSSNPPGVQPSAVCICCSCLPPLSPSSSSSLSPSSLYLPLLLPLIALSLRTPPYPHSYDDYSLIHARRSALGAT